MNDLPVGHNDVTQALSRLLIDAATGKRIEKTKVERQIDISDALCRRMQARVNYMKVYIEAKKHGVDFASAMKEIREADQEVMRDSGIVIDEG